MNPFLRACRLITWEEEPVIISSATGGFLIAGRAIPAVAEGLIFFPGLISGRRDDGFTRHQKICYQEALAKEVLWQSPPPRLRKKDH